jgi:hypothetical protein
MLLCGLSHPPENDCRAGGSPMGMAGGRFDHRQTEVPFGDEFNLIARCDRCDNMPRNTALVTAHSNR